MDKIIKVHDYLDSLPEIGKVLSFGSILRVAEDLNNKELQDVERLYTIFKNIENLEISIEPYIILILSLENFEINNLLRYFIIKWNTLLDNHTENSFVYTLEDFSKISKKHSLHEFLNIIEAFIQNDQNKSFFILNALQNYFYPF